MFDDENEKYGNLRNSGKRLLDNTTTNNQAFSSSSGIRSSGSSSGIRSGSSSGSSSGKQSSSGNNQASNNSTDNQLYAQFKAS